MNGFYTYTFNLTTMKRFTPQVIFAVLSCIMLFSSCKKDDDMVFDDDFIKALRAKGGYTIIADLYEETEVLGQSYSDVIVINDAAFETYFTDNGITSLDDLSDHEKYLIASYVSNLANTIASGYTGYSNQNFYNQYPTTEYPGSQASQHVSKSGGLKLNGVSITKNEFTINIGNDDGYWARNCHKAATLIPMLEVDDVFDIDVDELSILKTALEITGLYDTLTVGTNGNTLLAPTNVAFNTFLSTGGYATINDVPVDSLKKDITISYCKHEPST